MSLDNRSLNGKRKSISYAKWGYIFILPFFLVYLVFTLVPQVLTIYNSFFTNYMDGLKQVGPDFVGLSENPEDKEKTQIIIAKHRNGETCDIDMLFKSEQIKFVELDDSLDMRAAMTIDSAMNTMVNNEFL